MWTRSEKLAFGAVIAAVVAAVAAVMVVPEFRAWFGLPTNSPATIVEKQTPVEQAKERAGSHQPDLPSHNPAPLGLDIGTAFTKSVWLNARLPWNWNRPRMAVPRAPKYVEVHSCPYPTIQPSSPEERMITEVGWRLCSDDCAPLLRGEKMSVIEGFAARDGMCRPNATQGFVFFDGSFAGTVSPQVMESRSDGDWGSTWTNDAVISSKTEFEIEFARYADGDPFCCPSGLTVVKYRINSVEGAPVVVPVSAAMRKSK
ncbi:LppP/LprE family lipoprotein [Paludibaculum fermentans]|uniref:LppP/LprE family lipoprotein n=1 Tax=Paludibaculum fermentans TaxID=1473598 RepID=UPI003EBFA435